MHAEAFFTHLERLLPVRRGEPMARHTTFRIGGPTAAYVSVHDCQRLRAVASLARQWEVPTFFLGAGSNLLVGDEGIDGLVVETRANKDPFAEGHHPRDQAYSLQRHTWVYCGIPLPRLAYSAAEVGLGGLEWAVGIPGTVGGAVVDNAGAHGGSMADVLRSVVVLGAGEDQVIANCELGFGYRTSHFRGTWASHTPPPVILAAELTLRPETPAMIQTRIAQYVAHRRATQPSQRSIGSIFKNPSEHPAGWLIEQAGLKGRRVGDAQISSKHANFIVNRGHARAAEVDELMALAHERVKEVFAVDLEPEIQRVGTGF